MTDAVEFITLADVIEIHNDQIEHYGGISGIRDLTLLQSALAVPGSTFDGKFLHDDIFLMAAAYLYHICRNHPFLDGNKRTALASAFVFLDFNGFDVCSSDDLLYETVINTAEGLADKEKIAEILKSLSQRKL